MDGSPDLRGRRARIAPADHEPADNVGLVVDQVPCQYCAENRPPEARCGLDNLIIELPDGQRTRLYEPEADPA
jgi:hypothetical protein